MLVTSPGHSSGQSILAGIFGRTVFGKKELRGIGIGVSKNF